MPQEKKNLEQDSNESAAEFSQTVCWRTNQRRDTLQRALRMTGVTSLRNSVATVQAIDWIGGYSVVHAVLASHTRVVRGTIATQRNQRRLTLIHDDGCRWERPHQDERHLEHFQNISEFSVSQQSRRGLGRSGSRQDYDYSAQSPGSCKYSTPIAI